MLKTALESIFGASLLTEGTPFLQTDVDPWGKLGVWKKNIDLNQQPVIGILTQTLETKMQADERFSDYKYYIMSSYVKYMEASGARVVPILYDESKESIDSKLSQLDGILFPGGDGDNYDLGQYVFEQLRQYNNKGHFYPAWGTCLGYENMIAYTTPAGLGSWGQFDLHHVSLPLIWDKEPKETRMYEGLGDRADEFASNNFTYNSHRFGIAPSTFETDDHLKQFWDVTSHSLMPNGTAFVASIESKDFPFFGTQFHPEKPSELWIDGMNINHEWESIQVQKHFADLFVEMSRANPNTFGDFDATQKYEISNYPVIETHDFGDVYVF